MAKIVISYRRQDTGQIVASIYNYVAEAFGPQHVFVDTKGIPDGQYFTLVIEHNIRDAAVMLVVIGKNWLGIGSDECRRIDEPDDLVRAEVRLGLELARQGRLTLIPVLVDDATMPLAQELPDDLAYLRWRNAAQIHSSLTYLPDDMNRLLGDIDKAGIPRSKAERIEQPPDRAVLLGGFFADGGISAQAPDAALHPAATAPTVPTVPTAPTVPTVPTAPTVPTVPTAPPPVQAAAPVPTRPASSSGSAGSASSPAPSRFPAPPSRPPAKPPGALEVIVMLLLGLPGLIRGILVIGVIVVVVIAVMNLNGGLTEHSTCQQYEQASYDAQTKVLQQMMKAHGDNGYIGTDRLSLGLYCNIEGPNAPIDGIYSG